MKSNRVKYLERKSFPDARRQPDEILKPRMNSSENVCKKKKKRKLFRQIPGLKIVRFSYGTLVDIVSQHEIKSPAQRRFNIQNR